MRKGSHHSKEAIEKNKKAHTGIVPSEVTREKLRQIGFKRKQTEVTKEKCRISKLGNHYKLGYKCSEDTRRRMAEIRRGPKSHLWKGGIYSKNEAARRNIEVRLWREAVFARDNWVCQKCEVKGGTLNAHHVKNFSQYPDLRISIGNGITFCKECHKEFHKIYTKKNNTKEQLIEFGVLSMDT